MGNPQEMACENWHLGRILLSAAPNLLSLYNGHFIGKSRVYICKHSVNEKPSPAVRRRNSFCFYGIAAAIGLRHTNGNIGVTIGNIRPLRFSFSLPLLQFQKRFLASSAKNDWNKPSYPLFTTTTAWPGRVGKAGYKNWTRLSPCPICTSNLLIFIQS